MDNSYRAISDAYSYHWALDVAQRRLNSRPAQSVASSLYRYLSINCTNDDKSVNQNGNRYDLFVILGTAADIIEFFDSFKDDKIAAEPL
jgi:hypothetical protein